MEREILVKGSGQLRVPPDRAVVQLTIDADGPSREAAYQAATGSAARVDEVLAAHRDAIDRVTTAALVVQPRTRWKKGESVRTGWRAARRSTVEITGFDRLGELLARLAGAGATIAGPEWTVDPGNPAHLEVRQAAAEDARRRAEAYVTGLGLQLGEVRWLAEPGLRQPAGDGGFIPRGVVRAAAAPGAAGADEVIDVSPADLTIEAAIEVSFAVPEG